MKKNDLEQLFIEILGSANLGDLNRSHKYLLKYHGDYSEEIARTYLGKKARKLAEYNRHKERDVDGITKQIREREAVYLGAYTDLTPNDRASIWTLAFLEVQMKDIERQLLSNISPEARSSLLTSMKSLSAEHRQREHLLGIDKRTRDEDQGGSDMVDKISEIMDDAAAFYSKRMVEISHCGIKLGHILAHFTDWEFRGTCPRCGKRVVVTDKDMKEKPYAV